jgi:hypothetical protein
MGLQLDRFARKITSLLMLCLAARSRLNAKPLCRSIEDRPSAKRNLR